MDKETLIVLGVIGAFVALFVAGFIARNIMSYVTHRQKTSRRGY